MLTRVSILICIILASVSFAQERALLRIGKNGVQEAIPLKKGENAKDVIEQVENERANVQHSLPFGLIDTIQYFRTESDLTTNFGWLHQDVAFQWFVPGGHGMVKEFWWRNHELQGESKKATIRGWHANPNLLKLPSNAFDFSGRMGYYEKLDDNDGLVTPFKEEASSDWFYKGNGGDTTKIGFDPLGTEAKWIPGGIQITLESNKWQGITLSDWGEPMIVSANEPFGFTLMNDSKEPEKEDIRMELLSMRSYDAPYHSIKFYEHPTSATNTPGWQIRSYEWGMYVVVDYCTDRPPIFNVSRLSKTISTQPRTVTAYIDRVYICYEPRQTISDVYLLFKAGT